MYSVSEKYADFQQNMFWKHKNPRCIQDEVMSYRGIKFPEKIGQKAVQQQQQQQQMEKDQAVDQEVKLMAKGIEVYERICKKMIIPREEKNVDERKTADCVKSEKLKVILKNKDEKINNLTKTLLNQQALTEKQSLEILNLKDDILNAETDKNKNLKRFAKRNSTQISC